MAIHVLDRFKGCLIGLAVGDYLGMPAEFYKRHLIPEIYEGYKLKPMESHHRGGIILPKGYYTDDTSLTICLTESLIEKGFDISDQFMRYRKWFIEGYATPFGDKAFGLGGSIFRALITYTENTLPKEIEHKEKQGGNGALMRCSPLALRYYKDYKQMIENTIESSIVTHNNRIAVETCIVHNSFIVYSLLGYDKTTFIRRFLRSHPTCELEIKEVLKQDFNHLNELNLNNSGYSLNTLTISIYSFLTTNNYEDCITKAIFMGGDTDTQGAVAGSLAGAYYGMGSIPQDWIDSLINKDYLLKLAEDLY